MPECPLALCGVPCGCQGRNPTHPTGDDRAARQAATARALAEEARQAPILRGPWFTFTDVWR